MAGTGVNPADQRWGFRPLLPLSNQLPGRSEGLVPELSMEFRATGLNGVQLRPSRTAPADKTEAH